MGNQRLLVWPEADGLETAARFLRVLERRLDRPSKQWLLSEELEWMLDNVTLRDMLDKLTSRENDGF